MKRVEVEKRGLVGGQRSLRHLRVSRPRPCPVAQRLTGLTMSGLAPKYTKRPWQEEEDNILRDAIEKLGVPEISGGKGSGKTLGEMRSSSRDADSSTIRLARRAGLTLRGCRNDC